MCSSSRTERFGFTLTEVLVVVAMISLLGALLLPAILNARGQARGAMCRSNLHRLAMAAGNYVDDYNEAFFPRIVAVGPLGRTWKSLLDSYVRSESPLRCPNAPLPYRSKFGVQHSYGYNEHLGTDMKPFTERLQCGGEVPPPSKEVYSWGWRLSQVQDPTNVIMFCDSSYYTVNFKGTWAPSGYHWMFYRAMLSDECGLCCSRDLHNEARHNGGVNVVFVDGHTKWMRPSQFISKPMHWMPSLPIGGKIR